jgi:hypothetical protein
MDDVIGLLIEQIAKGARGAAERKRGGPQPARVAPPGPPAPGRPPGSQTPVSAAPPPPARVAGEVAFGATAVDAENPFAPAPLPASGGALPGFPASQGEPALLGAFAGGAPFLAAFVLGEALAPPVALREPHRF